MTRSEMRPLRKLIAATLVALAAAPAGAAPSPAADRLAAAYPNASRLCGLVAGGQTPKRLAGSAAQVGSACGQLQTRFAAAQTGYLNAVRPLRRQARATIQQYVQLCRLDRLHHDARACRPARQAAIITLHGLRAKARAAAQADTAAVTAAGQAFWATIGTLRGGAGVEPDPAGAWAPASPVPPDFTVPRA
jgi:hypothetical protein